MWGTSESWHGQTTGPGRWASWPESPLYNGGSCHRGLGGKECSPPQETPATVLTQLFPQDRADLCQADPVCGLLGPALWRRPAGQVSGPGGTGWADPGSWQPHKVVSRSASTESARKLCPLLVLWEGVSAPHFSVSCLHVSAGTCLLVGALHASL